MALPPLASTADLDARGITEGDVTRALGVASAAIRDAAGAVIGEVTSTLTVSALCDTFLPLPSPVTSVSAVTVDGTSVTDYTVENGGLCRSGGWGAGDISVTFTHGLAEVPDDIVDLTCQLAVAWLDHTAGGGGSTAGLQSVAIDDAREGYTAESAGQVSPVYVPEVTRRWLAARFGGGAAVVGTR